MQQNTEIKHRVTIVGAGFAGLSAAKRLARHKNIEVKIIDRNNYHTFQPLLYQVAAAELESGEVANPLRGLLRKRSRSPISVAMAEVLGVDTEKRVLHTDGPSIPYDYLILAAGGVTNFFGTQGAEKNTFTLKTLEDAVRLRNNILYCFEQAALLSEETEMDRQKMLSHIVVVGGGPTGVEYAGALAELIRTSLARDFPDLKRGETIRVTLLEAADQILPGFPSCLCHYAHQRLARMGVTVQTKAQVTEIRDDAVVLADGTVIPSATVVWTAGVRGNDVATQMGLPIGRGGRVNVLPTLQVAEYPEIFVAGDLSLPEGQNPPMVAPNAMQQGRLAADNILRSIRQETLSPFVYRDKGSLAVIGRNAAVARLGRFHFSGFVAWILWLGVHLSYLVGFHNRVMVLIDWAWDYFFAERSVRLILPREDRQPKA